MNLLPKFNRASQDSHFVSLVKHYRDLYDCNLYKETLQMKEDEKQSDADFEQKMSDTFKQSLRNLDDFTNNFLLSKTIFGRSQNNNYAPNWAQLSYVGSNFIDNLGGMTMKSLKSESKEETINRFSFIDKFMIGANIRLLRFITEKTGYTFNFCLHNAAAAGNLELCREILNTYYPKGLFSEFHQVVNTGPSKDYVDWRQYTPLYKNISDQVAIYEKGGKIPTLPSDFVTPLIESLKSQNSISKLNPEQKEHNRRQTSLKNIEFIVKTYLQFCFQEACYSSSVETVTLFLPRVTIDGSFSFDYKRLGKHEKVVLALLSASVGKGILNYPKLAVACKNTSIFKYFYNPEEVGTEELIDDAAENGSVEILDLLTGDDAKAVIVRDNNMEGDLFPFFIALKNGQMGVCEYFRGRWGGLIRIRDIDIDSRYDYLKIYQYLIESGLMIDMKEVFENVFHQGGVDVLMWINERHHAQRGTYITNDQTLQLELGDRLPFLFNYDPMKFLIYIVQNNLTNRIITQADSRNIIDSVIYNTINDILFRQQPLQDIDIKTKFIDDTLLDSILTNYSTNTLARVINAHLGSEQHRLGQCCFQKPGSLTLLSPIGVRTYKYLRSGNLVFNFGEEARFNILCSDECVELFDYFIENDLLDCSDIIDTLVRTVLCRDMYSAIRPDYFKSYIQRAYIEDNFLKGDVRKKKMNKLMKKIPGLYNVLYKKYLEENSYFIYATNIKEFFSCYQT